MNTVTFNKTGYDPFIDFIKAYAIICVLIGHTLPYHDYWGYGLWAGMQVPLFVLVQSFHVFKKPNASFDVKKVLFRVILPYFLIQSIAIIYMSCRFGNQTLVSQIKPLILAGGFGPGSYYPCVYLQIAILLPFIKKWMDKGTKSQVFLQFLLLCESLEILSSIFDLPDFLYRLLAVRYFFLFYFGWIWTKDGVQCNKRTIVLSLISFLSIIYFEYFSVNDEILFYNTAWKFHRWPCYYFVAVGGVLLLHEVWIYLSQHEYAQRAIKLLSKCSYEIFLVQMLIIPLFPAGIVLKLLETMGVEYTYIQIIVLLMKIIVVFVTCIVTGYYFNYGYNKIVQKLNR